MDKSSGIMEVVNWSPVGKWSFKTSGNECNICKQHYEEPCLDCTTTHVGGELICDITRGKCGHCYHKHCINKWLTNSNICPICSTPYVTELSNMANNEEWKKLNARK
jgi:RING-box protein 1